MDIDELVQNIGYRTVNGNISQIGAEYFMVRIYRPREIIQFPRTEVFEKAGKVIENRFVTLVYKRENTNSLDVFAVYDSITKNKLYQQE